MSIFGKYGLVRSLLSETHVYEYSGDRVRVFVGNIKRWCEEESGGNEGAEISVTVDVYNHFGEFDGAPEYTSRHPQYLTHGFSIMLWRYGISVHWRGREIDDEWDRPRWQLNRDGTLKKDYR